MKLDVTKPKYFQFNANIDGIDYHTLKGRLVFIYDNVAYGFETKIFKDRVEVEIPALQDIVKKRIDTNDELSCSLEIMGEGFFLNPWKEKLEIERSTYVDSSHVIVSDIEEKAKLNTEADEIDKKSSTLLEEDIKYLKTLKKQLSQNNILQDGASSEPSLLLEEDVVKEKTKISKRTPKISKNLKKKIKFDKKKFINEIAKIEEHAVLNGIPLEETAKEDTAEQLKLRVKVRKIFQEAFDKKQKNKQKQISEASKQPIENEQNNKEINFDNIKENDINKKTIIMMMESVGMTSERTHNRMIQHAKDKGAKNDVEIFYNIKNMLYPTNPQSGENLQENYQQQVDFFTKRSKEN